LWHDAASITDTEEAMRRTLLALASVLALSLLAVAPASAITGNFRDDAEHSFVGLVAFYDQDWQFVHRCTGELLTPTVLLTAGHCTDDETGQNVNAHARVWVLQDVGSHYDPVTQHDPVTGYPDTCTGTLGDGIAEGWCAESSTMYNYGFNNFAGAPDIHDVGVVILDQPIQVPEYAHLASAQTLDTLATARGTQDATLRVSGYGLSFRLITPPKKGGGAKNITVSFRIRLQADETLNNLRSHLTDGFVVSGIGSGAGRGGTCNGDSGGPVFWPADSNTVVAVDSFGFLNAGCRGPGFYYRTDRQVIIDWILAKAGSAAGAIVID
jgi:secreted trypsin-like serine protease